MTKTLCFAVCLLIALSTLAGARPLTPKEQAYTRALERQIGLKATRTQGLSSVKRGTSGVRIRFEGLTVVRLHFSSVSGAKAYAGRRARKQTPTKRVEVRGAEVLLIGGARARALLSAAWSASLDPPSVVARPAEVVIRRAGRAPLRLRRLRPAARPAPSPPTARTLAGSYLLVGSNRVVIDQVKSGPDGSRCRVRFEGFRAGAGRQVEFRAFFDGHVLVLTIDPAKLRRGAVAEVCYAWKPSSNGAVTFVQVGRSSQLLPRGVERFWHAAAE
ncbi:MAG: hypothetical protein JKY65_07490 [Planctomycetes bacterium]|nr:hypothetical protein [Planctomycetota bacterium]